jgi:predicted pyridoxine 5'-phosphate oxidase superfamily flavin-nucleotide-binding protein
MSAPEPQPRRPWHRGELLARRQAGGPEIAPAIRPRLSAPMRAFFPALPLVFVAGLDARGAPAASMLRGAPGFVACPADDRLEIFAEFPAAEPLGEVLRAGAPFGLIGLVFLARRRCRVNGDVFRAGAGIISLAVTEAFHNCPKYISPQVIRAAAASGWTDMRAIDEPARATISRADTFFIATRGPDGVDISHRGGPRGFVGVTPDGALKIADYPGNNYFNTFGNLLHDARAALLFPDLATGTALHLGGEARIEFSGEQRFWIFTPKYARRLGAGR